MLNKNEGMIKTKDDLRRVLAIELPFYGVCGKMAWFKQWLFHGNVSISRYIKILRCTEYYHNNSYHKTHKFCNVLNDLFYVYYHRMYETLGAKLGLEIGLNSCDSGIMIYHKGL